MLMESCLPLEETKELNLAGKDVSMKKKLIECGSYSEFVELCISFSFKELKELARKSGTPIKKTKIEMIDALYNKSWRGIILYYKN